MDHGRKALPTLNKHTDRKYYERCQQLHKKKLNNIKSCIDNSQPKQPSHLRNNRKKAQLREERFAKIERENRILLEKMSHIMQHNALDNKCSAVKFGRSLNKSQRKLELQRITQENQAILRRIQTQEATYDRHHWIEHAKANEKYLHNIREYPELGNGHGGSNSTSSFHSMME